MAGKSPIKNDILTRVRVLYILFIALGTLIMGRLIWVQVVSREVAYNAERLEGRIFQRQDIKAHRGSILSRDGEPLATSIFRYQVEMDFGSEGFDSLRIFHEQSDSLSKLLSGFFKDRSVQQYRDMFRTQRKAHYNLKYKKDTLVARSEGFFGRLWDRMLGEEFQTVKLYDTIRNHKPIRILPRDVDYTEWQTLRKFPILNWNMGMTYNLAMSDERVYPQGELCRRIIGKLQGDRGGSYGIEAVESERLAGQDGKVLRQRIARGFYGRVIGGDNVEAQDGLDVVTTLDLELMDVADKALRKGLERHKAIWGTTIVMEVETGDILAMVNLGETSSGDYSESVNNYAITARMEPGSTFKLQAMLALLDDAKMPVDQIYNSGDGKVIHVGKAKVQDSHKGYSEVDLKTAFAQSLNGYFSQAVYNHYKDHPQKYIDYMRQLRVHERVGFEAYGEPMPLFVTPGHKSWTRDMTLVYMGYGYGVELTPLQTATLYNAVANGGKMVAPRLIKEIRRGDKIVERFPERVLSSRIASRGAIDQAHEYLVEATTTGTSAAYLGKFPGMQVGAKTGTAQFAQGKVKYDDGFYLGSLVGYMPARKPKYTVMTAMFTRRGRSYTIYGGSLTGGVEQDIMRYLYNRDREWLAPIDTIAAEYYPRRVKGGDIGAIRSVSRELMSGVSSATTQSGWGRTSVNEESKVEVVEMDVAHNVMPNVVGMGLKDALFLLESRGLRVSFEGNGRVVSQSVTVGQRVRVGEYARITLR